VAKALLASCRSQEKLATAMDLFDVPLAERRELGSRVPLVLIGHVHGR